MSRAVCTSVLMMVLLGAGCDDGGGLDAGPAMDSGPGGVDAGAMTDAGFDAATSSRVCGPSGDCQIAPGGESGCAVGACVITGGDGTPYATACVTPGAIAVGDACDPSASSPCVAGAQCVGEPGDASCRRLCCADFDCDGEQRCAEIPTDDPEGSRGGFCLPPVECTPLTQTTDGSNGCPVGQACYVWDEALRCATPGAGMIDDPCSAPEDCATGLGCDLAGSSSAGTCRSFCDPMGSAAPCGGDEVCVSAPGFLDIIGYCLPE